EKNGGILIMNKEKALKNQGLEFREDIYGLGGAYWWNTVQAPESRLITFSSYVHLSFLYT
ncbi:hypothetical protein, partial [Blautia wexlerae]|uniref:hypothetical protein n=1 Tax=Blautia wexlerae TaxID=418240 RepID=UPI0019622D4E